MRPNHVAAERRWSVILIPDVTVVNRYLSMGVGVALSEFGGMFTPYRHPVRKASAYLNQPRVFSATYCFQARMRVQLAQNVLDVIVDGGATDVKLVGNA